MIIVYSCSKLYEKYLKVSAESVLKHNPDAKIVVITKEKLDVEYEQVTVIQHKHIPGRNIPSSWEGNAKAFITQLPYDKIIYLGADTLCQGSLKKMWDIKCDFINAPMGYEYSKKQAAKLGLDFYINVDSMVMNLKAMREEGYTQTIVDNIDNLFNSVNPWYNEETLINKLFHEKIRLLPQKYNYAYGRKYEYPMEYSEATILHFIGGDKDRMLKFKNGDIQ